jgi:hypothetical protein
VKRSQCQWREEDQRRRQLPRPWSPSHASSFRRRAPLFRAREGRVHEAFLQVEAASLLQVPGELAQHFAEGAVLHPALKPAVARLVRRVLARQLIPLGPGTQHPQDAVPQGSRVRRRSPRTVCSLRRPQRQQGFDEAPLFVSQVHSAASTICIDVCRALPGGRADFSWSPR